MTIVALNEFPQSICESKGSAFLKIISSHDQSEKTMNGGAWYCSDLSKTARSYSLEVQGIVLPSTISAAPNSQSLIQNHHTNTLKLPPSRTTRILH